MLLLPSLYPRPPCFFFFFFNDTATTEIYTLSLHDALPIYNDRLYVTEFYTSNVKAIDLKSGEVVDQWTGSSTDNLARQIVLNPTRPKAYLPHIRSRITAIHGSGSIFPYLSIVDTIAGDGTVGLDIVVANDITDTFSNAVNTAPIADEVYTVDNSDPTVSITRDDANPTHATSVVFNVDFSEDVTNVDAADFVLDLSGVTANATVTVGNAGDANAATYTVTVDAIAGDGTLGLDIVGGNDVTDLVTNAVNIVPTTDDAYTIVNNAPTITSSNNLNVPENTQAAITVTANDVDGDAPTFSITGGADQGKFSIEAVSGDLTFDAPPNYESPTDSDSDNTYLVEVTADDGFGKTDIQLISVSVTDVDEFDVGPIVDNDVLPNQVTENAANGTAVGITALASDADGTTNTIRSEEHTSELQSRRNLVWRLLLEKKKII